MIRKAFKCVSLWAAVLLVCGFIICSVIDRLQKEVLNWKIFAPYSDPYDNSVLLGNAIAKAQGFCLVWSCSFDLEYAINTAKTQRDTALIFALEDEDVRALNVAINPSASERVRFRLESQLEALMNKPNAKPAFMSRVGELYLSGEGVDVDYKRAYDLLARAWSGGDVQAPRHLTNLFKAMNDAPNTYLWSLRCQDRCLEQGLESRTKLDGNQILRIQSVAKIRTTMSVSTTPFDALVDMQIQN